MTAFTLTVLPDRLAVCRLAADAPIARPPASGFWSVTRTAEELSMVIDEGEVGPDWQAETGWRAFRVAGRLVMGLTGVLVSLTRPLADAGVPVFAISTFDTDYVLVKGHDLERSIAALREAGHTFTDA